MSFETVKELVQRIATDASYARFFVAEPEKALSSYRLDREERSAAMRLRSRLCIADGAGSLGVEPLGWP